MIGLVENRVILRETPSGFSADPDVHKTIARGWDFTTDTHLIVLAENTQNALHGAGLVTKGMTCVLRKIQRASSPTEQLVGSEPMAMTNLVSNDTPTENTIHSWSN